MKKIMFNDKYGLTEAVLKGRKTMTRRFIPGYDKIPLKEFEKIAHTDYVLSKSRYQVGDIIAVAQSYHELNKQGYLAPEWLDHTCEDSAGYDNKMFVRADLMPHGIKITGIKVERLCDISDEDCIKEGVFNDDKQYQTSYTFAGAKRYFSGPRKAFASLIDKVSGKGTWESNPYVFVYSFEVIELE